MISLVNSALRSQSSSVAPLSPRWSPTPTLGSPMIQCTSSQRINTKVRALASVELATTQTPSQIKTPTLASQDYLIAFAPPASEGWSNPPKAAPQQWFSTATILSQ